MVVVVVDEAAEVLEVAVAEPVASAEVEVIRAVERVASAEPEVPVVEVGLELVQEVRVSLEPVALEELEARVSRAPEPGESEARVSRVLGLVASEELEVQVSRVPEPGESEARVSRVLGLVASEELEARVSLELESVARVSRVPESVELVAWVGRVLELVASLCDLVVLARWRKGQLFVRPPRWELRGWRSETVSQASIPE